MLVCKTMYRNKYNFPAHTIHIHMVNITFHFNFHDFFQNKKKTNLYYTEHGSAKYMEATPASFALPCSV